VVALHTASPGLTREVAQESFANSVNDESSGHWWYGGQHLYEVFLKPIYFGPAAENRLLGFLVIGYEIDDRVASQVSRIAASQVAFYYGMRWEDDFESDAGGGTGSPAHSPRGSRSFRAGTNSTGGGTLSYHFSGTCRRQEIIGAVERFEVLRSGHSVSGQPESAIAALGLAAVLGGSALVFFISHTFTRPLANLVEGVRALEKGDFTYALDARGGDETAEVTGAFNRMRSSLRTTQQELLEAERLATIGRMASSISHDLRHSLAAIVANAEFLCESRLSSDQREELYQEIRAAVNQMTDLIDSLLEFSRTRESLRPTYGKCQRFRGARRAGDTFASGIPTDRDQHQPGRQQFGMVRCEKAGTRSL